jgi:hypothetical protein
VSALQHSHNIVWSHSGLVRRKLAAAEREVAMAGGKTIEMVRIRITAAGRRAISGE